MRAYSYGQPLNYERPAQPPLSLRDVGQTLYNKNVQGLSDVMSGASDVFSGRAPTFSEVQSSQDAYYAQHPNELPSMRNMFNRATEKAIDFMTVGATLKGLGKIKKPWEMKSAQYNEVVPLKPTEAMYVPVGRQKVEVVQNPSSADFKAMKKEALEKYGPPGQDPPLRFTEDAFGNKYYWKSFEAIHPNIEPELSKRLGVDVNQNAGNKMSHRGIVRRALYEGKTVPKSVSDEYPGLVDEVKKIKGNMSMDEASRMGRARDMGFDTDKTQYIGSRTDRGNTLSVDDMNTQGKKSMPGIYSAEGPGSASIYAIGGDAPNITPVFSRANKPLDLSDMGSFSKPEDFYDYLRGLGVKTRKTGKGFKSSFGKTYVPRVYEYLDAGGDTLKRQIQDAGYDHIIFHEPASGKTTLTLDPSKIRSKFAKFDPRKANSKDITAGLAGLGLSGTLIQDKE